MDPIEEISDRCHRLLKGRIFLIDEYSSAPYKDLRVGRVYIYSEEEIVTVHLHRPVIYIYTSDVVYSEFKGKHKFSSWPLLYDALTILRLEMVLDDLATA